MISYEEYQPIFKKIADRKEFFRLTGLNPQYFSRRSTITNEQFEIMITCLSHNFVGKKADYDEEQLRQYFKALTTLINTPEEFQLLSKNQKNKLINEQITIHNQLLWKQN